MFVENPQGSSDCSFDLPAVVEPALFRVAVESSMRCAADSASVAIAFGQRGKKPLCSVPSFRLVAWKLSGIDTLSGDFRQRWSSYCLEQSEITQIPHTIPAGKFGQIGVWEGVTIPCAMQFW